MIMEPVDQTRSLEWFLHLLNCDGPHSSISATFSSHQGVKVNTSTKAKQHAFSTISFIVLDDANSPLLGCGSRLQHLLLKGLHP
ncbi:hypothetical protein VNO78_31280 [Psophocarpus tetragonolobus]|uniref:Uncharacterized protein n=1 Tax=Psophocarpus tetragonolobus TaxID=3891 RepID=A0AAN9X7F1_PSOTE